MQRLKNVLNTYVYVTTLVVLASAVYISLFWKEAELDVGILWQILGTSLVCSLGMLVINPEKVYTRRRLLVINTIYYVYVNVAVLTAGFLFEWFYPKQSPMVAGMVVLIALVFAAVRLLIYFEERKTADQIMQKLHEKSGLL